MTYLPRPLALATSAIAAMVLLSLVGTGPVMAEEPDPISTPTAPKLMVVGDSISSTSRYDTSNHDKNNHPRAWWAYVALRIGADPSVAVSAEAGSGMLNRGTKTGGVVQQRALDAKRVVCNGRRFGDRLSHVTDVEPDILIIEGGRNDFKRCSPGRYTTRATSTESRVAIRDYLKSLKATIKTFDMDPSKVFVMTPWGTEFDSYRQIITGYMEHYADANGFTYVPVPTLRREQTTDGTHPNALGSKDLATWMIAASDISVQAGVSDAQVASWKKVSGESSRCHAGSYAKVRRHSFWDQSANREPTNYIAYQMTLGSRRAARIPGATPDGWLVGARGAKLSVSGVPKTGSVAWWPTDPNDRSSGGHLAYVDKVYGSAVTVCEEVNGKTLRRARYAGDGYPRAFITFPQANGTPTGKLTSVTSTKARRITIKGYATDADRYGTRLTLRVEIRKGSTTIKIKPSVRPRFAFNTTLSSAKIPHGKVEVRLYADNAAGGGKRGFIGKKIITLK